MKEALGITTPPPNQQATQGQRQQQRQRTGQRTGQRANEEVGEEEEEEAPSALGLTAKELMLQIFLFLFMPILPSIVEATKKV